MTTLKLNDTKRNLIANVIEEHFRNKDSRARRDWKETIENFDLQKERIHNLAYQVIRKHQPQEDIDTIKKMIAKYNSNGGQIYADKCFNFETDCLDDEGKPSTKTINIDFGLDLDFACSYFDDKLRQQGLDPDYANKYESGKRNPVYYQAQTDLERHFGFRSQSSGSGKENSTIKDNWNDSYRFEVIGSSYCGERQFKVDNETFEVFNQFKIIQEKVADTHKRYFEYIKSKMDKVRLGLKSYRTFEQAKELCDKLGIALNESILDTGSSMALSVYSPDSLAELLKDNDADNNKADLIAQFKAGKLNQAIN
jgi:hypothetical protein